MTFGIRWGERKSFKTKLALEKSSFKALQRKKKKKKEEEEEEEPLWLENLWAKICLNNKMNSFSFQQLHELVVSLLFPIFRYSDEVTEAQSLGASE